jgi:histidinol phosphatase-like enzyme (inositol monophosphatase family)
MPPPLPRDLLDYAVDLSRRAGAIALRWFESSELAVESKGDGTPVTQADRAAEELVRGEIESRFPDDAILGEEHGTRDGRSGRRWIVDPIDGTKAFMRGVPLFSTLVAMEDEHGPALGVIHLPALGKTIAAGRGLGCFAGDRRIRVKARTELAGATISTSGYEHWPEPMLLSVKRAGCVLRTWGDGYGYALVVTGNIDAMVDPEVSAWDMAPMPIIVTEAGGRFSALDGSSRIDAGSGVASSPELHEALMRALTVPR